MFLNVGVVVPVDMLVPELAGGGPLLTEESLQPGVAVLHLPPGVLLLLHLHAVPAVVVSAVPSRGALKYFYENKYFFSPAIFPPRSRR